MSIRQILTLAKVDNATGDATPTPITDLALLQDFVAELRATENSGAGTLTVFVEDTFDGVNWNAWFSFTALTATGAQVIGPTGSAPTVIGRPPSGDVRVRHTLTAGDWSYTVKISANPLR